MNSTKWTLSSVFILLGILVQVGCTTGTSLTDAKAGRRAPAQSAVAAGASDASAAPESSDPDYVPLVSEPLPESEGSKVMQVLSWNLMHLGRKRFDPEQAVRFLVRADIMAFQEVNVNPSGAQALARLARALQKKLELPDEKICVGLSEIPTTDLKYNERFGFLWRNSRVSFVTRAGKILVDCPDSALTIRLGVRHKDEIAREPAVGSFYFKPAAKQFVLAAVHLRPSGKKPQEEIAPLFETIKDIGVPIIAAGDYNLDSSFPMFSLARNLGFLPAMVGQNSSLSNSRHEFAKPYDNFWFRGVTIVAPEVVNIYKQLPSEMSQKEIKSVLSDHAPITAGFVFP